VSVGREALESSSAVLQTAATPSQLPAQTKRPDISRRPALTKAPAGGCGRHKRNGYTDSDAGCPALLLSFRSDFKSDLNLLIAASIGGRSISRRGRAYGRRRRDAKGSGLFPKPPEIR